MHKLVLPLEHLGRGIMHKLVLPLEHLGRSIMHKLILLEHVPPGLALAFASIVAAAWVAAFWYGLLNQG
jgi:hypothetical protein